MGLGQVQKMQLNRAVEQVLHAPGNMPKNNLEMAAVFDCSVNTGKLKEMARDAVSALKSHNELFRNVRLNTIKWMGDDNIVKEVTPMPYLQTGVYFEAFRQQPAEKRVELLMDQLKKFYARSKVILIFSGGGNRVMDEKLLHESLNPFLGKKLVILSEEKVSREINMLYGMNCKK